MGAMAGAIIRIAPIAISVQSVRLRLDAPTEIIHFLLIIKCTSIAANIVAPLAMCAHFHASSATPSELQSTPFGAKQSNIPVPERAQKHIYKTKSVNFLFMRITNLSPRIDAREFSPNAFYTVAGLVGFFNSFIFVKAPCACGSRGITGLWSASRSGNAARCRFWPFQAVGIFGAVSRTLFAGSCAAVRFYVR